MITEEQLVCLENQGVPRSFSRWATMQIEDEDRDIAEIDLKNEWDGTLILQENQRLFRNKYIWQNKNGPSIREQQQAIERENQRQERVVLEEEQSLLNKERDEIHAIQAKNEALWEQREIERAINAVNERNACEIYNPDQTKTANRQFFCVMHSYIVANDQSIKQRPIQYQPIEASVSHKRSMTADDLTFDMVMEQIPRCI